MPLPHWVHSRGSDWLGTSNYHALPCNGFGEGIPSNPDSSVAPCLLLTRHRIYYRACRNQEKTHLSAFVGLARICLSA